MRVDHDLENIAILEGDVINIRSEKDFNDHFFRQFGISSSNVILYFYIFNRVRSIVNIKSSSKR